MNNLIRPSRLIDRIIVFCLIMFCGFYLTKIGLSLVYPFFGFALVAECFVMSFDFEMIQVSQHLWALFLLIVMLIIPVELSNIQNINITIGFTMSLCVLPLLVNRLSHCSDSFIFNCSRFMIWLSLVLFALDSGYRLTHPDFSTMMTATGEENPLFYAYKFNSLMYLDSNFVGLHAVVLFGLVCYLSKHFERPLIFEKAMLAVMTCLSLSRASIVALVVTYVYAKRKNKQLLMLVGIILGLVFLYWGYGYMKSDVSFATKGSILEDALEFSRRKATLLELLFGVGFNHTVDAIDIGAHNVLVMLVIERGLLGFTLVFITWAYTFLESKGQTLYVLIPFLVNGFSLTSHSVPYLYVSLAIIMTLAGRARGLLKSRRAAAPVGLVDEAPPCL